MRGCDRGRGGGTENGAGRWRTADPEYGSKYEGPQRPQLGNFVAKFRGEILISWPGARDSQPTRRLSRYRSAAPQRPPSRCHRWGGRSMRFRLRTSTLLIVV